MRRFLPGIQVFALALVLIAGCGEDEKRFGRRILTIDKVPADIMAAAKKELPDVKFEDAWENHEDNKEAIHSYEIRGRATSGKIREVRVGLDGKILEKE